MKRIHNLKALIAKGVLIFSLLFAIMVIATPYVFRSTLGHAPFETALSNGRQIKVILDSFAMDHDGRYPNRKTAELYQCPIPINANEAFLQLFVTENTSSERIFWVQDSAFCSKKRPDDVIKSNFGSFAPEQVLEPGDNGFSYFMGLENFDNPSHPLLVTPFRRDLQSIDPKPFDAKAVVVHIDGSAQPYPLNRAGLPRSDNDPDLLRNIHPTANPTLLLHPAK